MANGVAFCKVNFIEAAFPLHADMLRGGGLDAAVHDAIGRYFKLPPVLAKLAISTPDPVVNCLNRSESCGSIRSGAHLGATAGKHPLRIQ